MFSRGVLAYLLCMWKNLKLPDTESEPRSSSFVCLESNCERKGRGELACPASLSTGLFKDEMSAGWTVLQATLGPPSGEKWDINVSVSIDFKAGKKWRSVDPVRRGKTQHIPGTEICSCAYFGAWNFFSPARLQLWKSGQLRRKQKRWNQLSTRSWRWGVFHFPSPAKLQFLSKSRPSPSTAWISRLPWKREFRWPWKMETLAIPAGWGAKKVTASDVCMFQSCWNP